MTKEEVRKLAISYMELSRDSIVYDMVPIRLVALQIGLLSPELQIFALECNDLALNLIQRNKAYLNRKMYGGKGHGWIGFRIYHRQMQHLLEVRVISGDFRGLVCEKPCMR